MENPPQIADSNLQLLALRLRQSHSGRQLQAASFRRHAAPRRVGRLSRRAGVINAAPFSFFNIVSTDPPLVAIAASDRTDKDTRYNIRERGELVVHMVRCSPILRASGVRAGRVPTSVWHRAAQQDSERTMAWADLQIIEINFRN